MSGKRCTHCCITKPLNEFDKDHRVRNGLTAQCTLCRRLASKYSYYRTKGRKHHQPFHIRFWEQVDCTKGKDACWLWTNSIQISILSL